VTYWACAQLEPRREAVAEHFLQLAGFEVYIPRLRERRIRSGRRVEMLTPLFPSYAFVAIENGWHRARWSVAVCALVMSGESPAVVPAGIIVGLRAREIAGAVELPARELVAGDRVRVLSGPFRDQLAIFAGMKPRERVEVLFSVLGRASRIVLARDDVEAIG
jgi:transcriptional antiterminator RfaH